eukprot:gb/GECH01004026.1/.p1 GENE.gb/GECH01004026.1/~~gb/GECH01004026.1/.p1  ORF type:complete len:350 (+),score=98.47 gb/GECH01004026.1/:1-1050(+)
MSERDRIPGSWWFWYYIEALKTGSKCPNFSASGTKGFFGRKTINSKQIEKEKISVLVFFPDADQRTKSFLRSLAGAFKSAVTIGKNKNNIHVFVTCKDLQQFDEDLKTAPSCNLWSDINGEIANKFGVKPELEVVDMKSIFSGDDNKKTFAKRTIPSVFFIMNGEIIKSPAYQPRFQAPNVGTIKGCLEYLERANFDRKSITGEDSFGADMTKEQIQTNQPEAWKEYQKNKMNNEQEEMNLKSGATKNKSTSPSSNEKRKRKNISATSTTKQNSQSGSSDKSKKSKTTKAKKIKTTTIPSSSTTKKKKRIKSPKSGKQRKKRTAKSVPSSKNKSNKTTKKSEPLIYSRL